MMPTITHDEITRLSPEERLTLIGELWDSLDPADVPVTPTQRAELRRRLDSFEQDRSDGITWEQLRAQLARRAS
jgi:putative addiction module component (TIGR02574 family)